MNFVSLPKKKKNMGFVFLSIKMCSYNIAHTSKDINPKKMNENTKERTRPKTSLKIGKHI
jgi:hypothetical protein